ncbi:MAG TPA: transketolase family protein [Candidatus Gastranaerophilales bacterium]|nr:transketolase family protein [Candidatus Gastranaerophilales bacterium]
MLTDNKIVSSLRQAYGETLVQLGAENKNIVVLDADLACSTQTIQFKKAFPERFFNMGVAEQDAIGTAAGLAYSGKTAFFSTFAVFASGRAWDQVRCSVAYPKFDVKIVATHGGVTVGEDGATHQALEDISLMRSLPNMKVIIPADSVETKAVIRYIAENKGPYYVRLTRPAMPEIFDAKKYKFDMKAKVLVEGKDITIATYGETVVEALKCAEMLKEKGISAEIINVPVIKPLDEETILKSARKTGAVLTVENHSIIGGLGSAVCELLAENQPLPVKRVGVRDVFGQSGEYTELMKKYGLVAEKFIEDAMQLIEKK